MREYFFVLPIDYCLLLWYNYTRIDFSFAYIKNIGAIKS